MQKRGSRIGGLAPGRTATGHAAPRERIAPAASACRIIGTAWSPTRAYVLTGPAPLCGAHGETTTAPVALPRPPTEGDERTESARGRMMPPRPATPSFPGAFLRATGPTHPDSVGAAIEGSNDRTWAAAVGTAPGLRRMVNAGRASGEIAPVVDGTRGPPAMPGDSAAGAGRGSRPTMEFAEATPPAGGPPICRSAPTEDPPGRDRAGAIWRPVAPIEDRPITRPLPPPTSRPALVGVPAAAARPACGDGGEPRSRGWAVREAPDETSGSSSRQPARTSIRRNAAGLPGSRHMERPPCERAVD